MATDTKIEWCDSTFNPWIGCTKVSPGCDHCYAERQMDQRLGQVRWGNGQPRLRTSANYWRQPLRWDALGLVCADCGQREANGDCPCGQVGAIGKLRRRRVFCASLADVFDNEVLDHWRTDLFSLIRATPNLDWLLLTKRIGNARRCIDSACAHAGVLGEAGDRNASDTWGMLFDWSRGRPPKNIWLGATICNQDEADRDIPKLLATPAVLRFLSVEPMLGPIDLYNGDPDPRLGGIRAKNTFIGDWWEPGDDQSLPPRHGVDWVICGGESGPRARAMNPDWVRSLRDQCQAAEVPFFFKQWGAWAPNCLCNRDTGHKETPRPEPGGPGVMFRCQAEGGRKIDEREWSEVPDAI